MKYSHFVKTNALGNCFNFGFSYHLIKKNEYIQFTLTPQYFLDIC